MFEFITPTSMEQVLRVIISTASIYIAVITYTRIAGLRSFSKMSGFDFTMTIAVGSLMATISVAQVSLAEGLVALATLYILQVSVAILRRVQRFKQVVDNTPMLLVKDGQILWDNMKRARITEDDLFSKLRESNVVSMESVHAVILETTGDVSVLHGGKSLDQQLLTGVQAKKT